MPVQQSLCSDCHATLAEREPATVLLDVSDFGSDHPQFRPSVMTDSRISSPGLAGQSGQPAEAGPGPLGIGFCFG